MSPGALTRGLADTSLFVAVESGRALDLEAVPDELAISVISIAELRAGVLAATDTAIRARRLATLTSALVLDPIPLDEAVAAEWATLRVLLRDRGRRIPINDSWIAATAMSRGIPVVTRDDDYPVLPGLEVVQV